MRGTLHSWRDPEGASCSAQVKGSGVLRGGSRFKLEFLFIALPCSYGKVGFPVPRAFCKAGITNHLCNESNWEVLNASGRCQEHPGLVGGGAG